LPSGLAWPNGEVAQLDDLLVGGIPLDEDDAVLMARRGGPAYLDSELARLGHLVALASTITDAVPG
jgi:hypothetical protein